MSMPVCGYVNMNASVCGGQKRATDLLQLELQVVVSHPAFIGSWVLGNKLGASSGRAGSSLLQLE